MANGPNVSPAFETGGLLGGIGVASVFTASTLDGYDNPPFTPGTLKFGTDGSEWIFVKAATVINQGDCLHIDGASNASQMTNALAAGQLGDVGFCQVAGGIASGSYGWVCLSGNSIVVNALTASTAGAAMYTTATAGVLSTTATSQVQIYGVKLTAANASGSTQATAAIAVAPRTTN